MDYLEQHNISWELLQTYVIEYGTSLFFALAIFVLGKWVAKFASNILRRSLRRAKMDEMLVSFFGNISYALMMAFVIIAALSELGVETTSIAAIFAAAGLAIGLALQGSLSNFAAGIMIVAFRPFKSGDYIEAAGTAGSVKEISIFTTRLETPDLKTVIIPNAAITSGNITNYSANKERRLDMVFGCGYNDDIKKAKDVLEKVVKANKLVLKTPAPVVAVNELGASSVDFVVRPWVKTPDYWAAKWEITEAVKQAFDKEGLTIPFPQRDVHLYEEKPAALKKAPAKKATSKKK